MLALFCFSTCSSAAIMRLNFSGSIKSITEYKDVISSQTRGDYNFHDGKFYVNQFFRGFLTYDLNSLPGSTLKDDPTSDIYDAVKDFSVSFGNYTYDLSSWPYSFLPSGFSIIRNNLSGGIKDVVNFSSPLFYTQPVKLSNNAEIASAGINLYDWDGNSLSTTQLPTKLDFSQFRTKSLSFLQMTHPDVSSSRQFLFIDGDITDLSLNYVKDVPTPAPWVFIPMFVLFTYLKKRRT